MMVGRSADVEPGVNVSPDWWPETGRATHAVVDLDAIAANVGAVQAHVGDMSVIAVVKANGYGHGAVMVGETALRAGATMLAVACVDEALDLRDAGISAPILVMGPADPGEYEAAFAAGIALSVALPEQVAVAGEAARRVGTNRSLVHIKVETGMNRYGAAPSDSVELAEQIVRSDTLELGGVFTHFADADGSSLDFTDEQVRRLTDVVRQLDAAGIDPGVVHMSNTAGTLRLGVNVSQAVRLGIGLYGLSPDPTIPLLSGMRPAFTLRTRVSQVRQLRSGDTVGYGRTWRADDETSVALLPIGYADGLRRALSNTGWVGIAGTRASIRGRVCMDQVVVVRPDDRVSVGTTVTVIGEPGTGAMTMDDAARLAGTINYEIATGISGRVPRWYLGEGRVVARLQRGTLERFDRT